MEHNDDKTQLMPSRLTWILTAGDPSIGDMVVTPGKVITLGRQTGCDIVIPDQYISRRHAEVFVRDQQLFVRDLQSTLGTLVNGQPVIESALQAGDEIRLDKSVFVVQQLGGAAPVAEPAARDAADKTVIRRLDDVAASLDAAAERPPAVPEPAAGAVPAGSETAAVAPGVPGPAAQAPDAPAAASGDDAETAPPEDEARRSKNWWDPQDAGPMGTRLVPAQGALEEMHAALEPQVQTDRPMLVGISPALRDQQFELKSGKMIVGKTADADIRLDDDFVSDVHAQIIDEGVSWKVVNVLSANGTFVNGKKIQTAYLRSGDVVRFGRVDLQFVDGSSSRRAKGGGAAASPRRLLYITLGFLVTLAVLALAVFSLR